jgi:TRAP transporter 4TM/12TM fusion protein
MTHARPPVPAVAGVAVDAGRLAQAEAIVAVEEGAASRHRGWLGHLTAALLVAMSLFHLYAAVAVVPAHILRPVHVGFTLLLVFLLVPVTPLYRGRLMWWDIVCALLGVATIAYALMGGPGFWDRNAAPSPSDAFFGVAFVALVLEACRRTSGWSMLLVTLSFVAWAFAGPWLPGPWQHRGDDVTGMTGFLYQTLDGIFGTAVGVSSSLIVTFTIYGAFLQQSGAAKFFLDWSFAATGRKPAGAGRTVVLTSMLVGGPSGSPIATTVATGSVAYPLLARAGYGKEAAAGLLAAGGLGAILSPPVLGAAAFLLAGFLQISYLDVLLMAIVPTLLYYMSLLVMVAIDTRRFGKREANAPIGLELAERTGVPSCCALRCSSLGLPGELTRRYGFQFVPLAAIIVLMLLGCRPVLAAVCSIVVTYLVSLLRRDTAMGARKLVTALQEGSGRMLSVAAACAAAGIVVGVASRTGLGVKFGAIVIAAAGGSLPLTALCTAMVIWVVGLAVPVTASYIIGAVLAAPALTMLGVPEFAAHLFIFYCAVLSGVSPLTGRLPRAAAAITGGEACRAALQSWKYILPTFAVPFVFVLDPAGIALLLKAPPGTSWVHVAWIVFTTIVGVVALAAGVQKWLLRACNEVERCILIVCGVLLAYPAAIAGWIGLVGVLSLYAWQFLRPRVPTI